MRAVGKWRPRLIPFVLLPGTISMWHHENFSKLPCDPDSLVLFFLFFRFRNELGKKKSENQDNSVV